VEEILLFSYALTTESTVEKVSAQKKKTIARVSPCFYVIYLSPIPNLSAYPSSPAAREAISVAIPIDLPRNPRVTMEKTNVSHGKK
jgi:hypothetical protein